MHYRYHVMNQSLTTFISRRKTRQA